PASARGPLPTSHAPLRARGDHRRPSRELGRPSVGAWPRTTASYSEAFRLGRVPVDEIVRRSLAAARSFAAHVPTLGPLCDYADERARQAAQLSQTLWREGRARGELEGVPIAVKEELDVEGMSTRMGTSFMPYRPAAADAVCIARLRQHGISVIGQTPMTEYGMSTLGTNANRRMPRNAHDPARLPGGSSSGSAVAVALGVVPLAIGCDGGGSVRVPAAYNGVFGLKPTYGRVPLVGQGSPGTTSVVHIGPFAGTSTDLALGLEAMAGADARDEISVLQPELARGSLLEALGRGVSGLRIGVDEVEWQEAAADTAGPCRAALDALEREGAEIVPLRVEITSHAAAIGYLTIALEAYAGLRQVRSEHERELGYDMQILLAGLDAFAPDDYLDAQRLRSTLRLEMAETLRQVDVVALPTAGNSAPPINDDESHSGIIDPPALHAACRFAFLGNLTGLPAASIPVGTDALGLPVGLQLIGDAWDEACVLQVAAALERSGAAQVIKPQAAVDLLADA
ncbi:MAG TPA: amidase, partial [Polyangiaceae bacterium]|nr:amidase [Polyangiaceae bacterium]